MIAIYENFTFLRSSAHEADATVAYRERAAEIVPTIPVFESATLQQQIDDVFGRERFIAMMAGFSGALALLLSAIGLFGLLSSGVTQRTGEMGVRPPLRAPLLIVQWMTLKEAFGTLGADVVLGWAVLYLTVKSIQSRLYRISAFDRADLFATIILLAVVAFLAAFLPALRASHVDPAIALRQG